MFWAIQLFEFAGFDALARALVSRPRCLALDEALGALAPLTRILAGPVHPHEADLCPFALDPFLQRDHFDRVFGQCALVILARQLGGPLFIFGHFAQLIARQLIFPGDI
jgi:hypothetical protein